jgi:hypothetical protein
VHPAGKNLIHTTRTLFVSVHIHHSYASCGQSPYLATFHEVINRVEQIHCSREKRLLTQSSTRRLTDPHVRHLVSLPQQSFKHMLATSYISLLGPYHQHMISMFNTCSRVTTPRFLTDPSEDYKLRGAVFPHYTPRPSQPTVLCFSLVVVLSLRLPNINISL